METLPTSRRERGAQSPNRPAAMGIASNRRSRERRDVADGAFAELLKGWEPPVADEHPLVFAYGEDPTG